jgi:hypothetical protein
MSPEEEWLDKNTFDCERFSCRMQPKQCLLNQKDANPVCIGCPQTGNIEVGQKTPAKTKWSGQRMAENEDMSHIGTCPVCKEPGKKLISRNGRCWGCYNKGVQDVSRDKTNKATVSRMCRASGCKKYKVKDGFCTVHHKEYAVGTIYTPPPPLSDVQAQEKDVLGSLLAPLPFDQGMFVPMDDDLYRRVQDLGLMHEDVAVLLLHLLDGHLRWRDEFSRSTPHLAAPAPLSFQRDAQPNGHKEAGA